jgi:hypothetical protein
MRYAIISDGVVQHVVELNSNWADVGQPWSWTPPDGVTVVQTDTAGKGWTYDGVIFTAPPPNPDPTPTDDDIRNASFLSQTDRQDMITRLKTATPAQIDTWLAANVTNMAQARAVLGALIKVLATNAQI